VGAEWRPVLSKLGEAGPGHRDEKNELSDQLIADERIPFFATYARLQRGSSLVQRYLCADNGA